jgi:hypothetical protein
MLCEEVIRELAVPTDDRDAASLAEHLARCPSCADWVKRAAQFDRLWEATSPASPSAAAWAGVWTKVAVQLDASTPARMDTLSASMPSTKGSVARVDVPVGRSQVSSRYRARIAGALAIVGLAQVAAVLLVMSLLSWRAAHVEIEEGHQVVIRFEGSTAKVVDRTPAGASWGVDDWYVMLNVAESLPNSVVAME